MWYSGLRGEAVPLLKHPQAVGIDPAVDPANKALERSEDGVNGLHALREELVYVAEKRRDIYIYIYSMQEYGERGRGKHSSTV